MSAKHAALAVVCAALAFAAFDGATYAASSDDLRIGVAKCAIISGQLDRLQCYDDLSTASGLSGPQPETPPIAAEGPGKWVVSRDKNPIDDSERVVIRLEADSGASRFNGPVSFVARCQSKETEAFVVWGEYLGNDGDIDNDYKTVTVRIGDERAAEQRWSLSTDSEATFAPSWAGSLLKNMASATRLVVQATPYNESPITAIFDTTGMKAALKPLADVCGWSIDQPTTPAQKTGAAAPTATGM